MRRFQLLLAIIFLIAAGQTMAQRNCNDALKIRDITTKNLSTWDKAILYSSNEEARNLDVNWANKATTLMQGVPVANVANANFERHQTTSNLSYSDRERALSNLVNKEVFPETALRAYRECLQAHNRGLAVYVEKWADNGRRAAIRIEFRLSDDLLERAGETIPASSFSVALYNWQFDPGTEWPKTVWALYRGLQWGSFIDPTRDATMSVNVAGNGAEPLKISKPPTLYKETFSTTQFKANDEITIGMLCVTADQGEILDVERLQQVQARIEGGKPDGVNLWPKPLATFFTEGIDSGTRICRRINIGDGQKGDKPQHPIVSVTVGLRVPLK